MSKGFITGTNEELIKAYKESRDESYLKELIEANKGLINLLVSPYLTSIPNSELEDLTSESYIPMLRAIEDYDPEQGVAFSTLLKVYVRQHLNRLYNEATRQKRFTGTTPDSLDRLSEINKESGTETDSTFEVECKDFSSVEFIDLLNSLQLNDKEQVAVNILMAGGAKGEIAKAGNNVRFLGDNGSMQNVLGIGVQKIVTDFGEISLVLDRYADTKTILTVDLGEVQIAELRGTFYEDLPKAGDYYKGHVLNESTIKLLNSFAGSKISITEASL